jgi:two-component system cell cycle sensor histidine kinase/response regulator CckA
MLDSYDDYAKDQLVVALREANERVRRLEAQLGDLQQRISTQRDAEVEGDLADKVRHAQKLESVGVLAGGIAHDFNNLLCGMLGGVELALDELEPDHEARCDLETVQRAARDATELCRQLLAYSGKGRFVVEPVDLSEMIRSIGQLLRVSAGKNVVLRFQLDRSIPTVQADASQMRQVVVNLVVNASEAIGAGAGSVTVATGVMDCDERYLRTTYFDDELPSGKYVFIEVADDGKGMDAKTQQRLFDPFFSTKFAGRGLGLAAAQGIVRGHRGTIKVYSEFGSGSTLKVLVPVGGEPLPSRARLASRPGWTGSGLVLMVDDEPSVRNMGQRILERLGFRVLVAEDGKDALRVFDACSEPIELVVLDMTMPNLGGEETFRELRRRSPEVRVVLTSGYNEQDATSRFAGKGLAAFVQKPFQLETLRATLQRVLQR